MSRKRRSSDAVARILAVAEGDLADPAAFAVVAGLIGCELATAFHDFRGALVRPDEVFDRGIAVLAEALAGLDRPQLVGLMCGPVWLAAPRLAEPTVAEAALDFAAWLAARGGDRDLALAFCRDLAAQDGGLDGSPDVRAALVTNPRLGRAVARRRPEAAGFLDRLAGRPELHELLADVAWGAGTTA
jgi:hypothetical protein